MIGCVGWCFSLRASKVLSFSPATESSEQGRWTAPLKSLSSSLEETSAASDASGSLTFRCRWRVWGCSGDGKCGRSNSALIYSLMTLNRLAPLATTRFGTRRQRKLKSKRLSQAGALSGLATTSSIIEASFLTARSREAHGISV